MKVRETFLLISSVYGKYIKALMQRVSKCHQSMEEVLKDLEKKINTFNKIFYSFNTKFQTQKNLLKAGFDIWSKMYYPKMVGLERLELSHLAAPEPKSGASTNSATAPFSLLYHQKRLNSNAI